MRIVLFTPAEDATLTIPVGQRVTDFQVEGRVESQADLAELSYSFNGSKFRQVYPENGVFAFDEYFHGSGVALLEIRARNTEGCGDELERNVTFVFPDLTPAKVEYFLVDRDVVAQGEQVTFSWRIDDGYRNPGTPHLYEAIGEREVEITEEGTATITIRNPDLESWHLMAGTEPVPPVYVTVGSTLRMLPDRAVVEVGARLWISIQNAADADWTVDGGGQIVAVRDPDAWMNRFSPLAAAPYAAAWFEASQPGMYTVRATSSDSGKREGAVTIEVRALDPAVTDFGEPIARLPSRFDVQAIAAAHDGSIVIGGSPTPSTGPVMLRLDATTGEWVPFASEVDSGSLGGRVSHLALDESGDLFAAGALGHVARIPADGGPATLVADFLASWDDIVALRAMGGSIYARGASSRIFRLDPVSGAWQPELLVGCNGIFLALATGEVWNTCENRIFHRGPLGDAWEMANPPIAPLVDLADGGASGLVAATSRGVFRLPDGAADWVPFGWGGPSGEGSRALRSGDRFFAWDDGGIWALDQTVMSWVRLPSPSFAGWKPFFLATPDGRLLVGDLRPGGAIYEATLAP